MKPVRAWIALLLAGAAIVGLVAAWRHHDAHVAQDAVRELRLAAERHRGDSLAALVRADSVEREAMRGAHRADSVRVDSLSRSVRVLRPGVVAITERAAPGAPARVAEIAVPAPVTSLLRAQSARIADLRAELVVADSGWAHERQLRRTRETELAIVRAQSHGSWCGRGCGIVLGALAAGAAVYLAGRLH